MGCDVQRVAEDKQRPCHRQDLTAEEGYRSILTLVMVSVQICVDFFFSFNKIHPLTILI